MAGNSNSGGRNAKPKSMHVVQGTFRADRHAGIETPEPPVGTPEPPKPLKGDALAEWKRMIQRLSTSLTLSIVDDAVLYQYAMLFGETEAVVRDQAENRRLSDLLKKTVQKLDGTDLVQAISNIVELRKGISKQTTQLRQQRMAIRQYLVEFGQTPAARTRVKATVDASAKEPKPQKRAYW